MASPTPLHVTSLSQQLLITVATTLTAFACNQPSTSATATIAPPPPLPAPEPSGSVANTSKPVVLAASVSQDDHDATQNASATCQKRETYCLPVGQRPPRPMHAPSPMPPVDADGCLAARELVDSCNGVSAVFSGPTARAPKSGPKQCCYEICRTQPAPCGRPLLVGAEARGRVAELSSPVASRSPIADAWFADALMEHASVASFARFTLELLSVGAPLDMVADAQRASLDELEHAKLCFQIAALHQNPNTAQVTHGDASAVSGSEVSGLNLAGLEIRTDLAEVAVAAVTEGCAGETFAALALRQASASCTDSEVQAVIKKIAEDEERHAALAFRFVAWAVATGGEQVRNAVGQSFDAALQDLRRQAHVAPVMRPEQTQAWRDAGRLTDAELAEARLAACAVLEPAAALLRG
jgi:hypothetical protein